MKPDLDRGLVFTVINTHVVGMRKGSKMLIYIDGDQKGSLEIGNIAVNNVGLPLYIGRLKSGYYSHADFDDIHIFNRALDLTEIRELIRTQIVRRN